MAVQPVGALCPCVVLADVSGSMAGEPIKAVQDGIGTLAKVLREDDVAADCVELAVVTFGTETRILRNFQVAREFDPPKLEIGGITNLGEAVIESLDLIERRRSEHKELALDAHKPWLVVLSDGMPSSSQDILAQAKARVRKAETAEKEQDRVACFFVGTDDSAVRGLQSVAHRHPAKLRDFDFASMFRWVARSLVQVSRSLPGETVRLDDPSAPGGWAEL